VGDKVDNDEYWDYLQSLPAPNIHFIGVKYGEELYSLYKNARALVHPSESEGYCLVVAEAISVNTPVILSDIPAHREFKLPQQCFFKVGDIDELSQKLSASNIEQFISQEAIDYQRTNTWTRNAQQYLNLYYSLCE